MDHVTDFHWGHEMQGVNRRRDHDASSMASGSDGPRNVDPRHDFSAENGSQRVCVGRENDFCHGHGGLTGRLSGRCFHLRRSSHIPRQKGFPANVNDALQLLALKRGVSPWGYSVLLEGHCAGAESCVTRDALNWRSALRSRSSLDVIVSQRSNHAIKRACRHFVTNDIQDLIEKLFRGVRFETREDDVALHWI